MTPLPIALTLLTALVGAVWITRHVKILREKRDGLLLTDDHPGPPESGPRVSMIVAAKDGSEYAYYQANEKAAKTKAERLANAAPGSLPNLTGNSASKSNPLEGVTDDGELWEHASKALSGKT